MLEKLKGIEEHYEDIQAQLADPAVYADSDLLRRLSREQKELEPIVEAYRAYRKWEADEAAARELLSDPELTAIQAYGVWQEKKNYGKVSMGVVRSTFVIDPNGVIEKVMPKVKPDTNAADILAYLKG